MIVLPPEIVIFTEIQSWMYMQWKISAEFISHVIYGQDAEISLADSTIDLLLMLAENSMNVDPLLCKEMDGK